MNLAQLGSLLSFKPLCNKAVLSIFLELEIEDPKVLSSLFLNIIDGLIIDGTINKPEINPEETWSYINKLIELETKQKYEAA